MLVPPHYPTPPPSTTTLQILLFGYKMVTRTTLDNNVSLLILRKTNNKKEISVCSEAGTFCHFCMANFLESRNAILFSHLFYVNLIFCFQYCILSMGFNGQWAAVCGLLLLFLGDRPSTKCFLKVGLYWSCVIAMAWLSRMLRYKSSESCITILIDGYTSWIWYGISSSSIMTSRRKRW